MEKKKLTKRKIQAAETKKRIYETAQELILKYGVENVSVDAIVKAAGVSKGSFYVHYESKDTLIADLINDYTSIADTDYKSFMMTFSDSSSVIESLIKLAEKISDFIDSRIGVENMKVLYKGHLSKTIDTSSAMDYNREIYKLFIEVLEKGVSQGEIRDDIPIPSLARHLILGIRGVTYEWCIRYPDFDLKEQVVDHFKILTHGIKRENK